MSIRRISIRSRGIIYKASDRSYVCTGRFQIDISESDGRREFWPKMIISDEEKLSPVVLNILDSGELLVIVLEDKREITVFCHQPDPLAGEYSFANASPDGLVDPV